MRDVVGAVTLMVLLLAPLANAQETPVGATSGMFATVSDEVRAMLGEWVAAVRSRDRAALERLYAPEFVFVHAYGYVDDRAIQIEIDLATDLPQGLPEPVVPFRPADNPLTTRVGVALTDVAVARWPSKTSDGAPALITTIYVKRNGRWQFLQSQGTEMLQTPPSVSLDRAKLQAFVGRYRFDNGREPVFSIEADKLTVPGLRRPQLQLTPVSETEFFDPVGGKWTFYRGEGGKVTHLVLRTRGVDRKADKVERRGEATARSARRTQRSVLRRSALQSLRKTTTPASTVRVEHPFPAC